MLDNAGESTEALLALAAGKSGEYDWGEASSLYQQILDKPETRHNPVETARLTELLARARFKHAFQAEDREEFKQRMQLAEFSYERARVLYQTAGSEALSKRAKARSLFTLYWMKDKAEERRSLIADVLSLTDEFVPILERQGDKELCAETHKDLLTFLVEAFRLGRSSKELESAKESAKELFERTQQLGGTVADEFTLLDNQAGRLEALCLKLWLLSGYYGLMYEPSEAEEVTQKAKILARQVNDASEKTGTSYALSLANQAFGVMYVTIEADYSKAMNMLETGLSAAEKTQDSLLIGRVAADSGIGAVSRVWLEDDVDKRRYFLQKGLEFHSIAIKKLGISLDGANLGGQYSAYAQSLNLLATSVENEPGEKKQVLRRAIEIGRRWKAYKDFAWWSGSGLSRALLFLATMDVPLEEKTQLLREALPLSEEVVRVYDLFSPNSWVRGSQRNYLALTKAELSTIEQNPEAKIGLLKGALSDMQQCIDLVTRWATTPYLKGALAHYNEWYGDTFLRLYTLTGEARTAQGAVQAYQEAIEYYVKLDHAAATAAIRWKVAKTFDVIGLHKEASEAFKRAAEDYRLGAQKIPASGSIFGETAYYMDGWALIEEARADHDEEQYALAAEKYTKAASILQQTRHWEHLSKHYTACSFLEAGEAQSRQEKQRGSVDSFTLAAKTFRQTRGELEKKLLVTQGSEEVQELRDWISISQGRERYCLARTELEEAKELDRKGEKEASATRYSSASQAFKLLMAEAHKEQSQKELETLALFCEAWSKMKEAEAGASPSLYSDAAELFLKTRDVSTRKKFGILALANSAMCKALESGTRFRLTRDTQLYSEVKKQLETATDYYEEAGVQNAADWTRATQRLFDALVYLADAETEKDPKKKTELYHLSEKHLQLAAKLYGEAGYPSRREEALRHLKRAREEKELLLTPMEALAENPASSEVTVAPVSLIRDQAVGLERFEAANVVGNLSLPEREVGVGSDLMLELEMANVGRTAATLLKLENLAPQGFELDRQKIPHRVEDNYIDMKGKRLEYLKTHEVKVPIKATKKGIFEIRPRILFVDEKGTYRSYDFEPAALTVRELGISGWLKGPK